MRTGMDWTFRELCRWEVEGTSGMINDESEIFRLDKLESEVVRGACPRSSFLHPTPYTSGFSGLVVSMLTSGIQVRRFKPGRIRRIFRAKKILSMPSFGREVKPSAPCLRFAACKRFLLTVEVACYRQNLIGHFLPIIPSFTDVCLSRRWTWRASGDGGGN
jgi:hypothetical protein